MDSKVVSPNRLAYAQHHLNQAYVYEEEGEYEKALSECDIAIDTILSLAEAHNLRGIVLEELDRRKEAVESYKKAVRLDPKSYEARANLMELESELGVRHRLITIERFSYSTQAYMSKSRLEEEGIGSFIADDYTVCMNWFFSNAIGGVKLQVKESDAARARGILHYEPYSPELRRFGLQCPKCNSFAIHYEKYAMRPLIFSWWLLAFLIPFLANRHYLVFGFPIPFLKRKWICRDCGCGWRANT